MKHASASKERLGKLLVQEGLIDEGQLKQALAEQKNQEAYMPLGEVCRELGFISSFRLGHEADGPQ